MIDFILNFILNFFTWFFDFFDGSSCITSIPDTRPEPLTSIEALKKAKESPWGILLVSNNIEHVVYHQISLEMKNFNMDMLYIYIYEYIFLFVIDIYELFHIFVFKILLEILAFTGSFDYWFSLYQKRGFLINYNLNLYNGLDLYYNLLVDILFDASGRLSNYSLLGLDYDVSIRTSKNVWFSDLVKDSLFFLFNRSSNNSLFQFNNDILLKDLKRSWNTDDYNELGVRMKYSWQAYVERKKWRFRHDCCFFWFKNDHWFFGYHNKVSKDMWLRCFKYFNFFKNIGHLSTNSAEYFRYWFTNSLNFNYFTDLRFFGGSYKLWYLFYQDITHNCPRFLDSHNISRWDWKINYGKWKIIWKYSLEAGKRVPFWIVPDNWHFTYKWQFASKRTINLGTTIHVVYMNKCFKQFLWSEDFFKNSLIFRKILRTSFFYDAYVRPIDVKMYKWHKLDFLVRYFTTKIVYDEPNITKSRRLNYLMNLRKKIPEYNYPIHWLPYKLVREGHLKDLSIKAIKTTIAARSKYEAYWPKWENKFRLFSERKHLSWLNIDPLKPIIIRNDKRFIPHGMPFEISSYDSYRTYFRKNVNIKYFWKYSKRFSLMLHKSEFYSLKVKEYLHTLWIHDYSKSILSNNFKKFFFKEKFFKKVFFDNIFYMSIKDLDTNKILMTTVYKKFWTFNENKVRDHTYFFGSNLRYVNYWEDFIFLKRQFIDFKRYYYSKYFTFKMFKANLYFFQFTKYKNFFENNSNAFQANVSKLSSHFLKKYDLIDNGTIMTSSFTGVDPLLLPSTLLLAPFLKSLITTYTYLFFDISYPLDQVIVDYLKDVDLAKIKKTLFTRFLETQMVLTMNMRPTIFPDGSRADLTPPMVYEKMSEYITDAFIFSNRYYVGFLQHITMSRNYIDYWKDPFFFKKITTFDKYWPYFKRNFDTSTYAPDFSRAEMRTLLRPFYSSKKLNPFYSRDELPAAPRLEDFTYNIEMNIQDYHLIASGMAKWWQSRFAYSLLCQDLDFMHLSRIPDFSYRWGTMYSQYGVPYLMRYFIVNELLPYVEHFREITLISPILRSMHVLEFSRFKPYEESITNLSVDNTPFCYWYFAYPFIKLSIDHFLDYHNTVIVPKNAIYNLYYNTRNITQEVLISKNKLILKNEFISMFSNIFSLEKSIYHRYFFFKERKDALIAFINELLSYIFIVYKGYIAFCDTVFYKWLRWFISVLSFIVFYFVLVWLLVLILKSELPSNNIYGLKTQRKIKETKAKDSLLHNEWFSTRTHLSDWDFIFRFFGINNDLNDFWKKDLKLILDQNITFGLEQKFIYSLTDKENFWIKKNIYDKYTMNINSDIVTKYKIFYKKFLYFENFNRLENASRYRVPFDGWYFYFELFTNNISWWIFARLIQKLLNDRFFNFGRFIKEEKPGWFKFELFEFIIQLPKSIVWIRINNFLSVIFGSFFVLVRIKMRHYLRAIRKNWYYLVFRKSLVVQKEERASLFKELELFFIKLKENKNFTWYRNNLDYFHHEISEKDPMESNTDLLFSSNEKHWHIHLWIWEFYNKFKIKDDKQWDPILYYYQLKVESYIEYQKNLDTYFKLHKLGKKHFSNFNFKSKDIIIEKFRFKAKCIDYLIFSSLLEIISDPIIQQHLKMKKKDIINNKDLVENVEDIEWLIKALGINTINYDAKPLKKDNWLNVLGLQTIINENLQKYSKKNMDDKDKNENEESWKEHFKDEKAKKESEDYYRVYRYYTTVGSRFYYLLSLFVNFYTIWFTSIKKIKLNEYDLWSLGRFFILDFKKKIHKIFWQYMLLFNEEQLIKTSKLKLRNILFFTFWIFTPLVVYVFNLLLIYLFIYFLNYVFRYIQKNINHPLKIYSLLRFQKYIIIFIFIFRVFSFFGKCIYFLLKDIKTGKTIFTHMYLTLYTFLGFLQRSFFFLKGAYLVGKTKKNMFTGFYYMISWAYFKLKVYFEDTIRWWKICREIKLPKQNKKRLKILKKKLSVVYCMLKYNRDVIWLFSSIKEFFYIFIYLLFSEYSVLEAYITRFYYFDLLLSRLYFYVSVFLVDFYKNVWKVYWTLPRKEGYTFLFHVFVIMPLSFLKGFFLYKVLEHFTKSWAEKKWRLPFNVKLHESFKNRVFSQYLYEYMQRPWYFEEVLEYRSRELSAGILDEFLAQEEPEVELDSDIAFSYDLYTDLNIEYIDWRKWNNYYINLKELILSKLWWFVCKIEKQYLKSEDNIHLRRQSPIKRLIYILLLILKKEYFFSEVNVYTAREHSRNRFFFRKWKERQKFIVRYFFKGLINWLTYITFKKVVFTKISKLPTQTLFLNTSKFTKTRKKRIKGLPSDIHVSISLRNLPPQLWLLAILYEIYYHGIIFYYYYDGTNNFFRLYESSPSTVYRQRFKWLLRIGFDQVPIASLHDIIVDQDVTPSGENMWRGIIMNKPKSLFVRYMLYICEIGLFESWKKGGEASKVWADTSLKYNTSLNAKKKSLIWEGRAKQTEDELGLDTTRFIYPKDRKYDDPLKDLYNFLETERVAKSIFQIKVSVDYVFRYGDIVTIKEQDHVHEPYIKQIYRQNGFFYDKSMGSKWWMDLEKRGDMTWRFERHLVHCITMIKSDERTDRTILIERDLNSLFEYISILYYDISLNQMISFINQSVNIRKKFVEYINVNVEPSLLLNLVSERYSNFRIRAGKQPVNAYDERIFKLLGYSFEKYIDLERNLAISWEIEVDSKEDVEKDLKINVNMYDLFYYKRMVKRENYLVMRRQGYYKSKRIHGEREAIWADRLITVYTDVVFVWNKVLSNRFDEKDDYKKSRELDLLQLKFLPSVSKKSLDLSQPLMFLNVVKLSWKQWLHFDLIHKEKFKFYKYNTIVLNEQYNLWCLKLSTQRLYLNLGLKSRYLETLYRLVLLEIGDPSKDAFFLPWQLDWYILRKDLTFSRFRRQLSSLTSKQGALSLIWLLLPENNTEGVDPKVISTLRTRYYKIRELIIKYYGVGNAYDAVTTAFLSWDTLQYYYYWMEYVEDFDLTAWYTMRSKSFLRLDTNSLEEIDDHKFLVFTRFDPQIYQNFFIYQGFRLKFITKYYSIFCALFACYELFLCPGHILYNPYPFFISFFASIIFYWRWRWLKKYVLEQLKGRDIYLYKYHTSRTKLAPRFVLGGRLRFNKEEWEKYERGFLGTNAQERKWNVINSLYKWNSYTTALFDRGAGGFLCAWLLHVFYLQDLWRIYKVDKKWHWLGYDYADSSKSKWKLQSWRDIVNDYYHLHRRRAGVNYYTLWYDNMHRSPRGLSLRVLDPSSSPWYRSPWLRELRVAYAEPGRYDKHYLYFDFVEEDWVYYGLEEYFEQKKNKCLKEMETVPESLSWLEFSRLYTETWSNYDYGWFLDGFEHNKREGLRRIILNSRRDQIVNFLNNFSKVSTDVNNFRSILYQMSKTKRLISYDWNHYYTQKQLISLKKKEIFNSGEFKYLDILYNLDIHEKHLSILYYNFMKYKYCRTNPKNFKAKNFKALEEHAIKISKRDIATLFDKCKEHPGIYDFGLKFAKVRKYIDNWSFTKNRTLNKVDLFLSVWNRKCVTPYERYEKVIDLVYMVRAWTSFDECICLFKDIINILKVWMSPEEVIKLIKLMIKLFF